MKDSGRESGRQGSPVRGFVILVLAAVFSVSLIVTLNKLFIQNYHEEMAVQFNKQQQLLAETISKDLELSIGRIKSKSVAFSRLLGNISLQSENIGHFIEDAFPTTEGIEYDIMVFDHRGRLRYGPSMPLNESARALLERSMRLTEDEALVDYSPQDYAVYVASPIHSHSATRGSIIIRISLESLTERFLAPVYSVETGHAWMMDSEGTLLYHPTEAGMVGKNLNRADASCFGCHKSFEVEKGILSGEIASFQSYIAPLGEDKIMAYSKVSITPEELWYVCVSVPFSDVSASITRTIKIHTFLVMAIFAVTAGAAASIVVINKKRIKAEAAARHEEELKQYAATLEDAVKKQTLELSSEKEKLDAIMGALDVGLFLADRDKKIVWMNNALRDWFGGRPDISLDEIYAGEEISFTVSDWMIQEIYYHTLGAKKGYFQITSTPLAGPDGNTQLLGLIHDVTEIKRFEQQLAHSDRLSSLGRLTAGIAHEIGNPLTSVFSFLQILREGETEDFKRESLDTVLYHINRIAEIVRQLSGLSKLPPVEFKNVQVNDIIESSLSLMQYDRRAKSITVAKDISPLPVIVTDGNQLSQVFVNLILNAVDAMRGGGTLTVRSRDDDRFIVVKVEDTGFGILQENFQKVFDPFFTTKEKGTGLGLSVSYGIIKGLGGNISVESEFGKGTVFTVTIPKRMENE